ncbi:cytochrome b [Tsuneonella sp. HG094]
MPDAVRYNAVARTLHWTIALLVVFNLASGLVNEALENTVRLIPLHKAVGLTILVLTLVRIGWRLTWARPPYPVTMSRAEVGAAQAVHVIFYILMLAMPLTGYVMASAGKYPLEWFGLFDVPKAAIVRDSAVYTLSRTAHGLFGWLFLGLALLHVAAALRHHFVLRDEVLRRML